MQLDEINTSHFGYLAGAPELRYTPKGTPVANFRVLTTSRRTDKDTGEVKEHTHGVRWDIWGPAAETLAKLLKKGSHVYVEGVLQNDSYDDPKEAGKKIYVDRHVVRKWKLLDRKPQDAVDSAPTDEGTGAEPDASFPEQN